MTNELVNEKITSTCTAISLESESQKNLFKYKRMI